MFLVAPKAPDSSVYSILSLLPLVYALPHLDDHRHHGASNIRYHLQVRDGNGYTATKTTTTTSRPMMMTTRGVEMLRTGAGPLQSILQGCGGWIMCGGGCYKMGGWEWEGGMVIAMLTADNDDDDFTLLGVGGVLEGTTNPLNIETVQPPSHLQMKLDDDDGWLDNDDCNQAGTPYSVAWSWL